MLEKGPQTLKETSFNQAYGRELADANEWCNHYKVSLVIDLFEMNINPMFSIILTDFT